MSSTNIYNDRKPYTYRIGWSKINIFYYGSKYGKKANPDKFWVNYFTSSNEVKKYRKIYGEPDIIEIRKVFLCPIACQRWERKILKKVVFDGKYLNKPRSANFRDAWDYDKNTIGMVCAKDLSGNIFQVKTSDPRFNTGEITYITTGKVSTVDSQGNVHHVYTNDPRYVSGELISMQNKFKYAKGKVTSIINGKFESISQKEFYDKNLSGNRKNKITLYNIYTKEKIDILNDDRKNYCWSWVPGNTKYIYITPRGISSSYNLLPDEIRNMLSHNTLISWCLNSSKKITQQAINASKGKIDKNLIGKTPKDLGYGIIQICNMMK